MKLGRAGSVGELNGFLDAGSSIQGDLRFQENFRVDGRLTGRVVSTGDLIVGREGEVDGEIEVANLYVFGTLRGRVKAKGRVEISRGSRIYADIETETFQIDEGARFEGHCKMTGKSAPEKRVGKSSESLQAAGGLPEGERRE